MRKILLAAVIIGISSGALAKTPAFPKGEPYASARESLLKQGWKPVHKPDPGFVCQKGDERCEGRPETFACAGTGLANCAFVWKRQKTVIEVDTVGEINPTIDSIKCKTACR
ncbi:MAG TPA: hypothetical protein VMU78_09965 [Methylocella sp.]|nr:hypothetical protein [Methylocella sp.]